MISFVLFCRLALTHQLLLLLLPRIYRLLLAAVFFLSFQFCSLTRNRLQHKALVKARLFANERANCSENWFGQSVCLLA